MPEAAADALAGGNVDTAADPEGLSGGREETLLPGRI
jgi:hypothetical protein